jgi:hypothetical protein
LTFKGGKLPNNAVNYGTETSQSWVLYRYAKDSYGYVDASLNDDDYSTFDIDWEAVFRIAGRTRGSRIPIALLLEWRPKQRVLHFSSPD